MKKPNDMKIISAVVISSLVGLAVQAQVIDPLTGSLTGYTTTLVNDGSHAGGEGVSFTSSGSGLQDNYVGTGTSAEQAVFLAPVTAFSTTFAVGDTLLVDVSVPASATTEDFGLAVSSTATPPAAVAGGDSTGAWSSRGLFDWASISVRPSQSSVRVNTSISGTFVSSANVAAVGTVANISELFIDWVSAHSFQLGYVSNNIPVVDETATFASSSTVGAAIGFYGDLRATGTSIGDFTNLTIVPEPSTFALCGVGAAGMITWLRRRK
jgi:hypothetical protein